MFDRARTRRAAMAAMVSGFAVGLTACVSTPPPPPPQTEVVLTLQADNAINPDPAGRASPARVHVYWLRGTGAFQRADFFALTGDPASTLGAELAAHEAVTVRPMEQQGMMRRPDPGVTHVGVVTAYRSLDGVSWRALAAFPANTRSGFDVVLGRNGVTMGQQTGPTAAAPLRTPDLAAR